MHERPPHLQSIISGEMVRLLVLIIALTPVIVSATPARADAIGFLGTPSTSFSGSSSSNDVTSYHMEANFFGGYPYRSEFSKVEYVCKYYDINGTQIGAADIAVTATQTIQGSPVDASFAPAFDGYSRMLTNKPSSTKTAVYRYQIWAVVWDTSQNITAGPLTWNADGSSSSYTTSFP